MTENPRYRWLRAAEPPAEFDFSKQEASSARWRCARRRRVP